MKKKDAIRKTAIRLFNEKGYTNVSLREIAKESGTTIGNFTYHYPQKEDLLIGIVEELHTEFLVSYPKEKHRAELLSDLLNTFIIAEKNQRENSFYYENILLLSLDSPKIQQKNQEFQKELFDYYKHIFLTLKTDGVLKDETSENAIESLAYTIITMNAVWKQSITPYNNDALPTLRVCSVIGELLNPFIAEDYKDEFRQLCKEKGI